MILKAEVTVLLPMQRIAPMAKMDTFCHTGVENIGAKARRTDCISEGKWNMRNFLRTH